ncbi:MAG TPA: diacylglycerol kinase family protein [Ktedonobacterales bacterium]|nr:diacylglycerol kinase family protein [Ktedonobacterales bacterium]
MESQPARLRQALMIASPHIYEEQLSIESARFFLRQQGIIVNQVYSVTALDGRPPLAEEWRLAGVELVIAAGGDGTIGAAATHLAHSDIPLGILPLGTSNDFARSLRLPLELAEACQVIAAGSMMYIDLGRAHPAIAAPHALQEATANAPGASAAGEQSSAQAFFTHALTLGLNVAFAQLATNATMRQRFGRFTYPVAALETLSASQMVDFTLRFGDVACALAPEETENDIEADRPYHYQALQVAVINAPVFGGQFGFALAGCELQDHLLDILIVERFDLRQLLAAAQMALTPPLNGRREAVSRHFPGIHHVKARQVLIKTTEPVDVTLDGELRGRTPILVSSAERALNVMVPHASLISAQSGEAGG